MLLLFIYFFLLRNHHVTNTNQNRSDCVQTLQLYCGAGATGLPEESAEPQCGVGQDPGGQLPQSLSVQHRDVGRQAVTQQGHVTLFTHILHPPGDRTALSYASC